MTHISKIESIINLADKFDITFRFFITGQIFIR